MDEQNTEAKIKDAAKSMFLQKGYAGTKTRDIAQASGLNLALVNYYFRSKEQLYEQIMFETLGDFVQVMLGVVFDESTSFEAKIDLFCSHYIDFLIKNPGVPLFILNEVNHHPERFFKNIPIHDFAKKAVFKKQYEALKEEGKVNAIDFIQIMSSLAAMLIFPFAAKPIISKVVEYDQKRFEDYVLERKKLIPIWVKKMIFV